MTDQLDQVRAVSKRPNARLGVVPWQAEVPRLPLCDFTVFDDQVAWVETFTVELTVTRAVDAAVCAAGFEAFSRVAVYGDAARAVVEQVRADYERTNG